MVKLSTSDSPAARLPVAERLLVSVCMPAYNVEKCLRDALISVLSQTHHDIEVILVDDGSTDRTPDVARSAVDERLRYVRNPTNLGGFQTMNKAVSLAKGDLVAIYHSDDVYEPMIIECQVDYLNTHPEAGAVFCLDHFMDESGTIFGGMTLPDEFVEREWLTYDDVFPFIMRHKNVLFCCPTFMVRREVLDEVGLFDPEKYDIAADLDLWIRIVRRFPIGILNKRLMRYRVGKAQWSSRYKRLRTEPELYFAVMDHYLRADDWLRKLSPSDLVEYAFHRCDDETFRAANLVLRGDITAASELLQRPYPWRTLVTSVRRRKLRVLLLRALMRGAVRLRAVNSLARFLAWSEYGGRIS
jgi:glycosyltransferase involved in cell wall biosynthesis